MKHFLSKYLKKQGFLQILLILFLFSLFFPIRHVFFNSFAYRIGEYSDFTSFSLYLSDILLVLLTILTFSSKISAFHVEKPIIYLFIWVLIVFATHYSTPGWYYLARWTEFLVAYGTIRALFKDFGLKSLFFGTFIAFSSLQSILALWQFFIQSFVGLNKLGEQLLSPTTVGFAKIMVNGIAYIRGYGTFPHPNPLSAFLCVTILIILYLLNQEAVKIKKLVYGLALFINVLGLTVTFSRAAFLAVFLGILVFFGILIIKKQLGKPARSALIVLATSIIAAIILFHPFLLTRTTVSDSASLERIFYAKIGVRMLAHNPIFGVGIGESVLHMQQYSTIHLDSWQIQPIHNYFLLAATELGIPGALILLWIFLQPLWGLIKKLKSENNNLLTADCLLLTAILCAFLVLMQFDHYFYTLQQTQMLMWLILGLIAAEIVPDKYDQNPKS
jgi:O-antigen ligase